jgi:hypothetical protein
MATIVYSDAFAFAALEISSSVLAVITPKHSTYNSSDQFRLDNTFRRLFMRHPSSPYLALEGSKK